MPDTWFLFFFCCQKTDHSSSEDYIQQKVILTLFFCWFLQLWGSLLSPVFSNPFYLLVFVSQRPQFPNKEEYSVWLFCQPLVREGRACKKQADAFLFFFFLKRHLLGCKAFIHTLKYTHKTISFFRTSQSHYSN